MRLERDVRTILNQLETQFVASYRNRDFVRSSQELLRICFRLELDLVLNSPGLVTFCTVNFVPDLRLTFSHESVEFHVYRLQNLQPWAAAVVYPC